jgi:hypothetical protein
MNVVIYNTSDTTITITPTTGGGNGAGAPTLRLAGTSTTGARSLAKRGLATIIYVAGLNNSEYVISGAGVF